MENEDKSSVEFLATLSRHTRTVNVVRFSPDGTHLVFCSTKNPSVAVHSLYAAVLALSSREIFQTVRINCCSVISSVRMSIQPSTIFIVEKPQRKLCSVTCTSSGCSATCFIVSGDVLASGGDGK